MPRRGKPQSNKPEMADHFFMQWWQIHVVEEYPVHERPQAWLFMVISMQLQARIYGPESRDEAA